MSLARHDDDPTVLVHAAPAALYLGDDLTRAVAHQAESAARARGELAVLPGPLEFRAYAEAWNGRLDAATAGRATLQAFEQFGALPSAQHAAAELRALGDTARDARLPATAALGSLTAQRTVIARMAADGATNREIATRMALSPRTIDHHLRGIHTRLGISSRGELARLVDA